jgi:excisionase family DNA binding protein
MRPLITATIPHNSHVRRLEAQRLIGISTPTFYRFVASGKLKAFKIGRSTCVKNSEIQRFLNSCPDLVSRTGLRAET